MAASARQKGRRRDFEKAAANEKFYELLRYMKSGVRE